MFEEHLLGFHIGNDEVTPCRSNVQKLIDIPVPKTKKQVQRLMGIAANFNRRFVPNICGNNDTSDIPAF